VKGKKDSELARREGLYGPRRLGRGCLSIRVTHFIEEVYIKKYERVVKKAKRASRGRGGVSRSKHISFCLGGWVKEESHGAHSVKG